MLAEQTPDSEAQHPGAIDEAADLGAQCGYRAVLYLLLLAVLATVYFAAARAGLLLQGYYQGVTPLWPPSGIAVALLWRFGLRWWPVIVIGEVAVALSLGQPLRMGFIGATAQTMEALLAFTLLNRSGVQHALAKPRQVFFFLYFAALLPPLVSATIGTTALQALGQLGDARYAVAWLTWWLGDAIGILVVAPFIIQWSRWPFADKGDFYGWCALTVVLLAAGSSVAMLERAHFASLFFLLLPFTVVASVRYGTAGASSTAVIMAVLVLGMKLDDGTDDWSIAIKIAFIGVTAFTGYLLAAAFAEQRRARLQLRQEQERALVTLTSIGDGVIVTDQRGATSFMNPAAERITGWRTEEARGVALEKIFVPVPCQPLADSYREGLPEPTQLHTKDGKRLAVECNVAEIHGQTGPGTVVTFRDISEAHRLRQELTHQAQHDPLTGLYNRRVLERELERLAERGDAAQPCALLYLDLDQFKVLNDTFGHGAGDQLLAQLGAVLSRLVAAPNLFARTGGDEFAVLLQQHDDVRALQVAEQLRRAILDYRLTLDGRAFSVGVSIGVAPFLAGTDSAAAVLSRADVACFKAKEEGRNRVHVYRVGDAEMVLRHAEMGRASRLQELLEQGRFTLHWQRIAPLGAYAATTPFYEVLLRLEEDGKLVMPADFISSAERFGFASQLDRWVVERSFAYLSRQSNGEVMLSINLAAGTLDDPSFFEFVTGCLARSSIAPNNICFEITEKVALNRLVRAVETIKRLRALGFRFALDDFGSGVASFGYLEELPVDYVKIDGRFVQGLRERPGDRVIVEALTRLATLKDIHCIAEWVQSAEVLAEVTRLGVAFAQGFYLHRPEPMAR